MQRPLPPSQKGHQPVRRLGSGEQGDHRAKERPKLRFQKVLTDPPRTFAETKCAETTPDLLPTFLGALTVRRIGENLAAGLRNPCQQGDSCSIGRPIGNPLERRAVVFVGRHKLVLAGSARDNQTVGEGNPMVRADQDAGELMNAAPEKLAMELEHFRATSGTVSQGNWTADCARRQPQANVEPISRPVDKRAKHGRSEGLRMECGEVRKESEIACKSLCRQAPVGWQSVTQCAKMGLERHSCADGPAAEQDVQRPLWPI